MASRSADLEGAAFPLGALPFQDADDDLACHVRGRSVDHRYTAVDADVAIALVRGPRRRGPPISAGLTRSPAAANDASRDAGSAAAARAGKVDRARGRSVAPGADPSARRSRSERPAVRGATAGTCRAFRRPSRRRRAGPLTRRAARRSAGLGSTSCATCPSLTDRRPPGDRRFAARRGRRRPHRRARRARAARRDAVAARRPLRPRRRQPRGAPARHPADRASAIRASRCRC